MPHLSSMGNQKLYRIVIDVQYGDMLDECVRGEKRSVSICGRPKNE